MRGGEGEMRRGEQAHVQAATGDGGGGYCGGGGVRVRGGGGERGRG